ncbi:nucleotidyltransferase domain-containing protein [Desulfoprunum benzoelyticum]
MTTARRHHATDVRLFGSVARSEDHDASDVDFFWSIFSLVRRSLTKLH